MLVYGDIEHIVDAAQMRAGISRLLAGAMGIEGRVTALIRIGQLVQGLLDQSFEMSGMDDLFDIQDAGGRLLLAAARGVNGASLPDDWRAWLDRLDSPQPVRIRQPEGYAFYALYPEAYAEAARRSGLSPRTVVIGLRSIGTSLSAMVAAALDAPPPVTVRPAGHPFARELRIGKRLEAHLLADPCTDYAIVDEGPGLSGSSFACVADWLETHGVARGRIHIFPGHGGDLGPQADAAHRRLWTQRPRHVVAMDEVFDLRRAVSEAVGCEIASVQDISGGQWRQLLGVDAPSDAYRERRKFHMRGGGRAWLVKFAGLGGSAEDKAARGQVLYAAGFTPRIAGTAHGFLIEEWVEGRPLSTADRPRLIDHIGRYLAFRAHHMSAPAHGASLDALAEMAVYNARQAAGHDLTPVLRRLKPSQRRIDSDNRLHPWEWRVAPDGRIVKTDALDHNTAHDLIGAQDIAWDIAGAVVEFGLSDAEKARLLGAIGDVPDADTLRAFEQFYLAFQAGLWTLAAESSSGPDRDHALRMTRRYICCLQPPG